MKNLLLKTLVVLCVMLIPNMVMAQSNASASQQKSDVVITQPEFKGGMEALYKYILTNFEYPEEAAKRSVSGTAEVEFTIEKSGDVTNVGILKGIHETVDDQILRLLQAMPRWTPATRNGVPVRYKVSMPLTLKLSRNKNGARSQMGLETSVFERY
ncbi:MAG: energy transducer TonB [Bacteroidaceae bacterium]|nr:energy transducer TonB [Bacteroidaceae bacterium]